MGKQGNCTTSDQRGQALVTSISSMEAEKPAGSELLLLLIMNKQHWSGMQHSVS